MTHTTCYDDDMTCIDCEHDMDLHCIDGCVDFMQVPDERKVFKGVIEWMFCTCDVVPDPARIGPSTTAPDA